MSRMVISRVTGASYGAEQWSGPVLPLGHSWHQGVRAEKTIASSQGTNVTEEWSFYVVNSEGHRWYLKEGDWIVSDWDHSLPTPPILSYAGVTDYEFKKVYRNMTERDIHIKKVKEGVVRVKKSLVHPVIDSKEIQKDLDSVLDLLVKLGEIENEKS